MILTAQYGIVFFIASFMLRKNLRELNKLTIRQRIGNLYFNLDTRKRYKLLFGIMFYFQRISLVLIVAIRSNFGIQWQLAQVVLFLNTAYILTAKPYFDPGNATLDYINCLFLIPICILIATFSPWNTNTYNRFMYGILFDVIVGL